MATQPINYNLDVKSPFESALRGYQTGLGIAEKQGEMDQVALARENAKIMQEDLTKLSLNKGATAADYAALIAKHPSISENVKRSWDILDSDRQQTQLNEASEIYSALELGQIDVAKKKLEVKKQAAINSKDKETQDKTEALLKILDSNPEAAKKSLALSLSAVMGPKDFAQTFSALNKKQESFKILTPDEKKKLGLPLDKQFQQNSEGKIDQIGGGGTNVAVNLGGEGKAGPIPPGFALRTKPDGTFEMYKISGGPASEEEEEKGEKGADRASSKEIGSNIVIKNLDSLKNKIEKAPWYSPITGAVGSSKFTFPGLRQNKVDAEELAKTITSHIAIDKIQEIRQSSPTGGSLGNISNEDMELLKSSLGSLRLNQGEKQLLKTIDTINTVYTKILKQAQAYPNASKYGFGKVSNSGTSSNKPSAQKQITVDY